MVDAFILIMVLVGGSFGQNFNRTTQKALILESELPSDCGYSNVPLEDVGNWSDFNPTRVTQNEALGRWPWMGALFRVVDGERHLLGSAILIHEQVAIASSRATVFQPLLMVAFGEYGNESYQEIFVQYIEIFNEPEFRFDSFDEIALLHLEKNATLSTFVKPICLWEAKENSLDVRRKSALMVSVNEDLHMLNGTLAMRNDLMVIESPVSCLRINYYSNSSGEFTDIAEEQMCAGARLEVCPGNGASLSVPRTTIEGTTQWFLRGFTIKRLVVEDCTYRQWVFIDVAQRRQWIDQHFRKRLTCGKRQLRPSGLIKGGFESKPGDWPWHVGIFHKARRSDNETYSCGGTLINPTTVITAGHCVAERKSNVKIATERFRLELGRFYLYGAEIAAQSRKVIKVILHPDYSGLTLKNDIALLKMDKIALYNDYVQPACLWPSDKLSKTYIVDKNGMVVGWGRTDESAFSDKLNDLALPVIEDTICYRSHPTFFARNLNDNNYCAGYSNKTGVCNGDSGGGMFFNQRYDDEEVWFLRGIVSLSLSTAHFICDLRFYVLFTDIAKYLDWIKRNMEK